MSKWYLMGLVGVALLGWMSLPGGAAATESPARQADRSRSAQVSDNSLPSLAKASAQAKYDVQVAWDELRRAEEAIPSRQEVQEQYRASQEYRSAIEELRRAKKAYESQQQSLLQRLESSPEYREAIAMRDEMQRKLDYVRRVSSIETRLYLAERKLHYAAQATRIRLKAQETDPEFQKVDQRLTSASQKMRQLGDRFEAYYRNHPAVVAAVERMERASEAYVAALRESTGVEAAYTQAMASEGLRTDWVGRYRYGYYPY
ncbi:MAG: hypothetical protein ACM359_23780 [Bacillota bacterium]